MTAQICMRWATLAVMVLIAAPAVAQGIYKWVDERGRVTYSSTPPPAGRDAKELQVQPGPSEQEVAAARKRTESVNQLSDQFAEERRKREQQAPAAVPATQPADTTAASAERNVERDTDGVNYPAYRPPRVRPRPNPDRPRPVPLPARPGVGGSGVQLPAGPASRD
jgi:hypothetical protein